MSREPEPNQSKSDPDIRAPRKNSPYSFGLWLMGSVLIVNLFIFLLLSATLRLSWQHHEEKAHDTAKDLAKTLALTINGEANNTILLLYDMKEEAEDRLADNNRLDPAHLNAHYAQMQRVLPTVEKLGLADVTGDVIAGSHIGKKRLNVADREYFMTLRDNAEAGLFVSKPIQSRNDKSWVIVLARRINYPDGSFAGVVMAGFPMSYIKKLFSSMSLNEDSAVIFCDTELNVVGRYSKQANSDNLSDIKNNSQQLIESLRSSPLSATLSIAGLHDQEERVVSYHKLPTYPFYVVVDLSPNRFMTAWYNEEAILGGMTFLFLLMSTLSATILYRKRNAEFKLINKLQASQRSLTKTRTIQRAGQEVHQAILKTTMDGFWLIDTYGCILEVNERYCQMSGYSEQELVGKMVEDFEINESREEIAAHVERIIAKGEDRFESRHRRKDGGSFDVEISVMYQSTNGGRFVSFLRDITEEKQVKERQKLFMDTVEASMDAIGMSTPTGKHYYQNSAFDALFGKVGDYPPESVYIDMNVGNEIFKTVVEGERWAGEVEMYDKDKRVRNILLRAYASKNEAGEVTALVGVHTDITELKRVETELLIHQKHLQSLVKERTMELSEALDIAELANQAKSVFLANMSHEIRTPLSTIVGLSERILKSVNDDSISGYCDQLTQSSYVLLHLVNDILDMTRIEVGEMTLEKAPVSLVAIINSIVSELSVVAENKGLVLIPLVTETVPRLIVGDDLRISQIFRNLISNAIKFTDVGEIKVTATTTESVEGARLLLMVQDSGIGIDEELLGSIFLPFQQADSSTARNYGGTGLGLHICQGLTLLMGGNIVVESVVGKGSQFTVNLPLHTAQDALNKSVDIDPYGVFTKSHLQGHILLVEDHSINAKIVKNQLLDFGLEVTIAASGKEAIALVKRQRFDLVLMDIQMPEMDGYETTRCIRTLPFGKIPILALSANAFIEDRQKSIRSGMNDHLSKPVEENALRAALTAWLSPSIGSPEIELGLPTVQWGAGEIDKVFGVRQVGGDVLFFQELLNDFVKEFTDVCINLEEALVAGEQEKARALLHGFVGVAANLGVRNLSLIAGELAKQVRLGRSWQAKLRALSAEWDCVQRSVASFESDHPEGRDQ